MLVDVGLVDEEAAMGVIVGEVSIATTGSMTLELIVATFEEVV